MAEPKEGERQDPIEEIGGQIPQLYFNGFQIGMSNADVYIVLKLNNQPTAIANLSYTLAKTLHERMGTLVSGFEKKVDRKMLVTNEIDAAFAESKAPGKKRAKRKASGKKSGKK